MSKYNRLNIHLSIRSKVLITLCVILLSFLGTVAFVSQQYLMDQFIALEQDGLKRNMRRIHNSLNLEKIYLDNMTANWGNWDECYEYVQHRNPKFGPDNIALVSFNSLKLELIGVWDTKYQFIMGKKFNLVTQKEEKFPEQLDAYVQKNFKESLKKPPVNLTDYVATPYGLMVLSLAVVTDTAVTKPPLGALIMGRMINKKFIEHMKDVTQADLDITMFDQNFKEPLLNGKLQSLFSSKNNFISFPLNELEIASFSILKDSHNKPVGIIKSIQHRKVYQLGKNTTNNILLVISLIGLLMIAGIYFLSNRMIISRLIRLKDELAAITKTKQFNSKVTSANNDEIGYVSHQINNMFNVIYESQTLLEERVQERTVSLAQANEHLMKEIYKRTKIENELLENREHLMQLAHYDSLTGLPNRVLLNNTLSRALLDCNGVDQKIAILFIDIDRFKSINDAKGHEAGDFVLKTIAKRISSVIGKNDMAARIGGDEFIISVLDANDKTSLDQMCESLLKTCAAPIEHQGNVYHLTASIGISLYPDNGNTIEDLQKNADIAMYQSKSSSPGNYYYFQDHMDADATIALQLDEQLHKAIENQEFTLYYQPKYDIKSGNLVGMEALIRWISPALGFVSPDQFIPYAEKSGLIVPIGKWVLEEVCRTSIEWEKKGLKDIKISLNMSPVQFNRQDVISVLQSALQTYPVNPQNLEIEITESAIMNNLESNTEKLKLIRELGFLISIDDFGTGYTSMNHIKIFPVDYLKIDRSFIMGIPEKLADMAIIECLVTLSHRLGINVVAEGVETAEQLDFLASIGCDIAQGYFFAKPLSKETMTYELEQRSMFQIEACAI